MSFDWRTDEDADWQEGAGKTAVRGEAAVAKWHAYWWLGLLGLLGIAAVWGVVRWQIKQQVTAVTSDVEAELLATQNFVLQTAVSQDEELFRATLSGRNLDWGTVQKTLLSEGLLLDRPMFGWLQVAQPRLNLADVSVALSPDLRAAELIYPQTYAVQTPTGITETVTMQQTAVYRKGNTRWLYAPPIDEFWGEWVTNSGEHLTLVYPTRDADVAEQLAVDLDILVGQICAELDDLNCADDLRLHLRLDSEPDALLAANEIKPMLSGSLRLNLPAPTLIGKPVDEAGYQALFRAYGVRVATAVLAHQVEYDCCRHQLFFRALRDYQLAQLGLQPWPLDEAAYSRILSQGFAGNAASHWTRRWEEAPPQPLQVYRLQEPEPIWQQVYVLVEYLATLETAVSPAEMMRLMDRSTYIGWLTDVLAVPFDNDLFATQLLGYIFAQSTAGQQTEPPLPLPSGSITLVCGDFTSSGPNDGIYQYNLASGEWRELNHPLSSSEGNFYINSVDGKRFLISSYHFSDDEENVIMTLLTEDGEILLEETHPVGGADRPQFWVNYYFVDDKGDFFARDVYDDGIHQMTIRETACPTESCSELEAAGWPLFSPDSNYFLAEAFVTETILPEEDELHGELMRDLSLQPTDSQTRTFVGQGGRPFWLNESTFAYWRWQDETLELVTAVLPQNEPHVLLNPAALLEIIPLSERPESLFPGFAGYYNVNPENPRELLLPMQSGPQFDSNDPRFLFKLSLSEDLATIDTIELLQVNTAASVYGYSPDGRYITFVDYNPNRSETIWTFLDQTTGTLIDPITTESLNLGWSPDGQWLIQSSKSYLLLHALSNDYQFLIPHNLGSCRQAMWTVDK